MGGAKARVGRECSPSLKQLQQQTRMSPPGLPLHGWKGCLWGRGGNIPALMSQGCPKAP